MDALREEMEEARRRVSVAPAHFVFVNGFPRMMDGFHLWQSIDVVKPFLVLVLEAPDDVLKTRAEARGREGDLNFGERLASYRALTEPVVSTFRQAGIARHIDATGSTALVTASACYHLQPTLVFACGDPKLFGPVCRQARQRLGAQVKRISVNRIRETAGSNHVVHQLMQELMYGCWGRLVVVEGFPQDLAELQAFPQQALLMLDFKSGLGDAAFFVRSFDNAEAGTVDAVAKLLQSCQPLQVAPQFMAVALLKGWMEAARHKPWWDSGFFVTEAQPSYLHYLRQQVALASSHRKDEEVEYGTPYALPSKSPPMEAWLCWLTHQLHTDSYSKFCQGLDYPLRLGPLPPAAKELVSKARASGEKPAAVAPQQLSLDSDALANVPTAFALALAAFEEARLTPLSDPRAIVLKADGATCNGSGPDLMSHFLDLMDLFYRRFLLVMGETGPESLAGPAVELDWVWHAHMTHPLYSDDCLRLFGHMLPHVPCKPGDSEHIRSVPPDAGRVAMSRLNELLRSRLRDLAGSTHLREALTWDLGEPSKEDDAIALGCFVPGGDRAWLSERLESAGGRLGQALLKFIKNPGAWICPCPTQNPLEGEATFLQVTVQLMSGEHVLAQTMHKDSTVSELVAVLREQGETEDLKLFAQGAELSALSCLGDTPVAHGAVVQLVRIKRPPPLITRRTSSPDWNRIPCTCFTDHCEFQVLVSGRPMRKFMCHLHEGDWVRTGSERKE